MSTPIHTHTPNVIIRDPKKRERIYDIFGVVGLLLFAAVAADAIAPEFDIAFLTAPATAVYSVIGAGIGYLGRANTPGV